jgi:WhiB family redox-sensing transcriptional regulator
VTILASSLALANAEYGWRRHAVCRDTDPDLFFPVGTTGQALVQIDRAKEVCEQCAVRTDCLQYALETNQDSGIWGGTSEEERRKLRREFVASRKKTITAASSLGITEEDIAV